MNDEQFDSYRDAAGRIANSKSPEAMARALFAFLELAQCDAEACVGSSFWTHEETIGWAHMAETLAQIKNDVFGIKRG